MKNQLSEEVLDSCAAAASQPSTSPPPPPPPVQEGLSVSKPPFKPSATTPNESTPKMDNNFPVDKTQLPIGFSKSTDSICPNEIFQDVHGEKNKENNFKHEGKKSDVADSREVISKEKNTKLEKHALENGQGKTQGNSKGNGCVISGICGKCCLKHGTNCLKMPGCNSKGADKNPSPPPRLGLSSNSSTRTPTRY